MGHNSLIVCTPFILNVMLTIFLVSLFSVTLCFGTYFTSVYQESLWLSFDRSFISLQQNIVCFCLPLLRLCVSCSGTCISFMDAFIFPVFYCLTILNLVTTRKYRYHLDSLILGLDIIWHRGWHWYNHVLSFLKEVICPQSLTQ